MAVQQDAFSRSASRTRMQRRVVRALLVLASFFFLWAFSHGLSNYSRTGAETFKYWWSGWLRWVLPAMCAGIAFGLAAVLPTRWHYHPISAFILGILPLLVIVHQAMIVGPLSSPTWGSFLNHVYFFDTVPAAEVFLGLAIAAGFGSSDEEQLGAVGTS